MAGNDFLGQVGRQLLRCPTLLLQHGDVVALGALGTLFPPQSQGWHVVRGDGADAAFGIGIYMTELLSLLLGHGLNLERQNA